MDTGDVLATLLIQISTVVGILASIWWPRKVEADSPRARALRALRLAAASLLAAYILILAVFGPPSVGDTPLQRIMAVAMLGTLPLTPLSSAALSVERGRRVRALLSAYGALLFAAALAWTCIIVMIVAMQRGVPLWRSACAAAATLCCAAGLTFIMELYAMVRQRA
jgi:hypothetical protein